MVDAITGDLEAEIIGTVTAGSMVQLRTLGGAMHKVPADATAFGNRHQPALVIGTAWDRRGAVQLATHWQWLTPSFTGAYGNFENTPDPATIALAFPPATQERLRVLKDRYDPDHTFPTWPE